MSTITLTMKESTNYGANFLLKVSKTLQKLFSFNHFWELLPSGGGKKSNPPKPNKNIHSFLLGFAGVNFIDRTLKLVDSKIVRLVHKKIRIAQKNCLLQ